MPMAEADAIALVMRLYIRRLEKAADWKRRALDYADRAVSANEVLEASQREFLGELGAAAERSAQAMTNDATALRIVLSKAGAVFEA